MEPQTVLVWTFVIVVILTAIVTFFGLVGLIRLGGGKGNRHDYYLKKLFQTVIIEVIIVAVGAFAAFLTNQNEHIEGLEELISVKASADSSLLSADTVGIPPNPDTLRQNSSTLPATSSVQNNNHSSQENSPIEVQESPDSVNNLKNEQFLFLSGIAYATTDNPKVDERIVQIPPGMKYVGHDVEITTRNGDAHYDVELLKHNNTIEAVRLILKVGERSLFGPRHWIGAQLRVIAEETK